MSGKNRLGTVIFLLIFFLAGIVFAFPLLWILATSFRSETEILTGGFSLIPKNFTLDTYKMALLDSSFAKQMPIVRWFFNSVLIAAVHTFLMLAFSSLSAFSFARLSFKGKNVLFLSLMTTLMIPQAVTLVPLYKIMVLFRWTDRYMAMIFPGLSSVFALFLMKQFMMGVPTAYDEAAKMDGANLLTIYFKIILPLIKPSVVVCGLFVMLGSWNDFLWPSIVTNDIHMRTLPAGLGILQSANVTSYGKLAVAAVVSAVPVFAIYLMAQKYFSKGLSLSGGVKG